MPERERPRETTTEQARRLAALREAFVAEVTLLTEAQVEEVLSVQGGAISRLAQEGSLISVTWEGITLYPAFQFTEDGRLHPTIQEVLQAFAGERGWAIALWFYTPSGWLPGGGRPLDLLVGAPDKVAEAARRTAEPLAV